MNKKCAPNNDWITSIQGAEANRKINIKIIPHINSILICCYDKPSSRWDISYTVKYNVDWAAMFLNLNCPERLCPGDRWFAVDKYCG